MFGKMIATNTRAEKHACFGWLFFILVAFAATGCAPMSSGQPDLPPPLISHDRQSVGQAATDNITTTQNRETRFIQTPTTTPPAPTPAPAVARETPSPIVSTWPAAEVNLDSLALPVFINEIYGNLLKVSFDIDSSLRDKKDLVTMRTGGPLSPVQLDALARQILTNYGVVVKQEGGLLRFTTSKSTTGAPPFLVSGRTLPEVPSSHRPVFQLIPLTVVRNTQVIFWLKTAFTDKNLQFFEDAERNAILLLGPPALVRQAAETVTFLDQPNMRGQHSLRIEPVVLDAETLAGLLVDVLNSEGYAASLKPPMGSIIILPIKAINALLVFAAEEAVLDHVREWAASLDKPGMGPSKDGFFYYQVRETSASGLVKTFDQLLSGHDLPGSTSAPISESKTASKSTTGGSQGKTAATISSGTRRLVVDEIRNSIVFFGNAGEWQTILSVLREMDRPPRQVLIEVTVAEITLSDQQQLGVEGLIKGVGIDNLGGKISTLGGLGIGKQGLLYTLDSAGQTRLLLNAFASHERVNILSSPRVMVKSGMEATIDVGTEVPTVTSQSTSSDLQQGGNSAILQQIQYRKTGVLLRVKPVVHSGNRVDLEVTQEVSEASPNTTSTISSPSILTRRIATSLSLEDGGSVLLGGLISTSRKNNNNKVPFFGDIPLLGRLFRVEGDSDNRTELIVLIVPYVLDSGQEAEAITAAFRRQLSSFDQAGEKSPPAPAGPPVNH